jgi:tricorn protease
MFDRISSSGSLLACEVAGALWLISADGSEQRKINVLFSDDAKGELRIETDLPGAIDEYALSPNGKYFALGVYGDIYLLKNEDAYPPDAVPDQNLSLARRIVATPGREMHIAWAPTNNELAYVSDRDGSFDVYVMDLTTLTERKLRSTPSSEEWRPAYAPQGRKLAYYSGNRKLMLYDLEKNTETLLVEGQLKHGPYQLGFKWSPDGQWIAYSQATVDYYSELFLLNIATRESVNVSVNASFNVDCDWSPDGKYLAYTNHRDWSSELVLLELNPEPAVYDLAVLFPEDMLPSAPALAAPPATEADKDESDGADQPEASPAPKQIQIETRRIHLRSEVITGLAGNAAAPRFDPTSSYLIFAMTAAGTPGWDEQEYFWWSVTLEDRQFNQITKTPGNTDPQFSPDGSKLFFRNEQSKQLGFAALQGPIVAGGGPVATLCPVNLDQYQIWDQMLFEGWRHLRDTFYKHPAELGVDWDAVLERYRPRVQFCGTTSEFNTLYREMLGELGGSHLGFYGGAPTSQAPPETTADFGVWFDESYAGAGWKVSKVFTAGPADMPGSRLYPGDLLLAINGVELHSSDIRDYRLRNLADKPVQLTVISGADAPEPGAERTVVIKPTSWYGMRQFVYEQWVEDNRSLIESKSDGKVGYLHIAAMDPVSLEKFRRELFAENLRKDSLIIDVRFNGGGNISEQLFKLLNQQVFALQAHRDGQLDKQPALSYQGSIAILINAHSYSDAEIFPHIMQQAGRAILVGEATGGNVIGTYDFPLLDGSQLRLPSWGWWLLDGRDMEGNGAQPDLPVVFDPHAAAIGIDNQLEAALAALLQN